MKSLIGAVIVTLLIMGTASAGQFGPPEPSNDVGKFSLGLGYWLDRSRMELQGDRFGTTSNQYYLQGDYSFQKDWEVYGRVGGADEKMHSRDTWQRFSDSADIFGTLGFKGVLYKNNNFALGPFVEGSWLRNCLRRNNDPPPTPERAALSSTKNVHGLSWERKKDFESGRLRCFVGAAKFPWGSQVRKG